MEPVEKPRPRLPGLDWILIGVFLLLLGAPALDKIFHLDNAPQPRENRFLASKPVLGKLSFGQLQDYIVASETYFNDHFGFRNQLVTWSQDWKREIYHDGDTYYHMVTGPNQWQFYGELQMVEHHLGWLKFTPRELQAWQILLEKRRDWLVQQHIQYLFVIAPDKQTIYPDELPRWLNEAGSTRPETKLDQFVQYMNTHSTVHILDLRPSLIAARKIAPMYLQHDTHWNLYGGFISCQQVIKSLGQLPDLPPLRLEDFDWTNLPTTGGDLASDGKEGNYFQFRPKPNLPVLNLHGSTNIVSMWDTHGICIAENPAPLTETAVIFHDSFGLAWQKFLGYEFKRTIFIPERREFNAAVISSNKPDVVINEIVERYLNVLDPVELMNKDALP